jgi:dihydroneopterin aldolase
MDYVQICGLSCRCIVGIRPRERRVSQPVKLNLELSLDLERAGKTGRIAHTVDYSRASSEIIALLQFRRYTLLEVAAEECAGWLFAAYPSVQGVTLGILKPHALAGQAESGGVRITRQRPPEQERIATDYGFRQSQLETNDASICVLGLEAGHSLTPASLDAERALLLPLSGRFEASQPLGLHEPTRLEAGSRCINRDAVAALAVVCAQRRASS